MIRRWKAREWAATGVVSAVFMVGMFLILRYAEGFPVAVSIAGAIGVPLIAAIVTAGTLRAIDRGKE